MNAILKQYAPHAVVILLASGISIGVLSYNSEPQPYDIKPQSGYSSAYYDIDPKTI